MAARAKYRGALLGVATGDALGAPFEGNFSISWRRLYALQQETTELRYTDDTHMTIGVAQSLHACRKFDGAHMARLFAERYEQEPWRGYGSGPPQVFRMLRAGTPWQEAARSLYGGQGSFGNGAAMRVAPVALFARGDLDQVDQIARQTAAITHAHELGIDGAALQACAVALVLELNPENKVDASSIITALKRYVRTSTFLEALDKVAALHSRRDDQAVAREIGNGIEAQTSVPAALCSFLAHPASFDEAIHFALSLGGDTDTIASMTGALSGAYLGENAIPDGWRNRIEGRDELVALADVLYDETTA